MAFSRIAVPQSVQSLFDSIERVDKRVWLAEGEQQTVDALRIVAHPDVPIAMHQDTFLSIHRTSDKKGAVLHRC